MIEALIEFIGEAKPEIDPSDLNELLYFLNEKRILDDFISVEQAIICWKIIEALKIKKLPEELKM